MTGTATDMNPAVESAERAVGKLPPACRAAVLNHLLSHITPEMLNALPSETRRKFVYYLLSFDAAAAAAKSQPVSEIKTIDGHTAVVGQITVEGEQLDTLLSEGSFDKKRPDQRKYATQLGYRMATHKENHAYYGSLLAKEKDNSINVAEREALETYRNRWVRDDTSGVDVAPFDDPNGNYWHHWHTPHKAALFVRASAKK